MQYPLDINIRKLVKWILLGWVCMIGLLIGVLVFFDDWIPSRVVRALPDSASDVHEYYWDDGFTGDFVRVLKARMPESDFPAFVNNLGLIDKYDPAVHGSGRVSFSAMCGEDWWNPPESLDNAYIEYRPGDDYYVVVKYHEGYAYFTALSW